jgi:hypothetical protein
VLLLLFFLLGRKEKQKTGSERRGEEQKCAILMPRDKRTDARGRKKKSALCET